MIDKFQGPLFLVGMPRSGKKLLRDLLNGNPQIGIPIMETSFIPYMIALFGPVPRFDDEQEFNRFYEEFSRTDFYWFFERTGRTLSKKAFEKGVDLSSWSSIFEFILKSYAPEGRTEDFIWGEKTQAYLSHLVLLKELYPNARFLHVIRDPRDHCLSCKKVFGKNLYRAAEVWREEVGTAQADSIQLGSDYKEVLYESILIDPEKTLRDICEFLNCEYTPAMTTLTRSPDDFGDTRGQLKIIRDNHKKYLTKLSTNQIKRIEEIVYPIAKSTGYKFENDIQYKPLSPIELKMYTVSDGLATLRFNIQQYGWYQGIRMVFHWHTRGSWVAPHLKNIRKFMRFSHKANRKKKNSHIQP